MIALCDLYLQQNFIHASFLTLIVHILVTEDPELHRASGPTGQTFFKKNFKQILEFIAIHLRLGEGIDYGVCQPCTDEEIHGNFGIPYTNRQLKGFFFLWASCHAFLN